MCNINLILRKDKHFSHAIARVMNVMSTMSFATNSDGEGYFGLTKDGWRFNKTVNKIIYKKAYSFLCTHQRLSTSGKNKENNHPHITKNLIVMHNGVFSGYGDDLKSDTAYFSEKLEKNYRRSRSVIKALQTTLKNFSGSWSLVVMDKNTGRIFYVKEDYTQMWSLSTPEYLVMSTKLWNLKYAKRYLHLKGKIKKVRSYRILDVLNNLTVVKKLNRNQYDRWYNQPSNTKYIEAYPKYQNYGFSTGRKQAIKDAWDTVKAEEKRGYMYW